MTTELEKVEDGIQALSFTEVPESNDKKPAESFKQVAYKKHRQPRLETHEFKELNQDNINLSDFITNDVDHYIKLCEEAINCVCSKILQNIDYKKRNIPAGVWAMNVYGPVFPSDFYVRLSDELYAFAKESTIRSGEIEVKNVKYKIELRNCVRIWDIICGPSQQPDLLRKKGILSVGEKAEHIIQANCKTDLQSIGKLSDQDTYTPTVHLFLAFRYNFRDNKEPCRFINMRWNSDGTPPKGLIKVSDYCQRNVKVKNFKKTKNKYTKSNQSQNKH